MGIGEFERSYVQIGVGRESLRVGGHHLMNFWLLERDRQLFILQKVAGP